MKKLLSIALLLLAGLTASAQGTWTISHRQADPMKGQEAKDVYIYNVAGVGSMVIWDWDKADFRLVTEKGMFRTWVSSGSVFVPVKAGFYDEQGNMQKMVTVHLLPEDNKMRQYISTADFYMFGRKDIRKIFKHLKSGKGYVRFVAERYNDTDFDMRVTPYVEPEQ